jgi:quercetin dioxygenase-like cupin family protein
MRRLCLLSLAIAAMTAVALAQDPVKVDAAHYKVILDNASVRVLNVTYPVGGKSVMHQHPDGIAVALAPSSVRFGLPDGKSQDSEMANESAMYMPAGTHNPVNIGKGPVQVIVVEFKAAKPGTAALPDTRTGLGMKLLAEGPRAIAYRATAAADFSEPAGTKHDFDQVVIALGSAQLSLSIDGKPAKTTWARGDVQFIGRGVPHESKNTGGKPVDMIIVAIK